MSKSILPHIAIGLAICVTTVGIHLVTNAVADEDLRLAVDDIENDCDDQLTLLLHANACDFAYRYGATNNLSHEAVLQLCDYCCIDEFSLVGADGRFLDTTDPGSKAGGPFFTDEEKQAPYRALLDGSRLIVRQRFRPSATDPNKVFKFFAMSLPDGTNAPLPSTHYPLPSTHYPLSSTHYPLSSTHYPLSSTHYPLSSTHYPLPSTQRRFLQIGYLWESFEREFKRLFLPIFETRRIGEAGFCVVVDEKDTVAVTIPGHPESKGKSATEIGFTAEDMALPLGQIFHAELFGTSNRCMAYPERISNYRIYAVVPLSESQGPAMALAGGVALVLLAAYLVFRLVLAKFREQQAKIDALREEEEKRRAADLALARSIQQAELRTDGTDGDGYRIATMMNAAREVGGDFYDYYELPDGRLVLTIADVSGKGVPAAFFMMKARMTLKSCVFSCVANAHSVDAASRRVEKDDGSTLTRRAAASTRDALAAASTRDALAAASTRDALAAAVAKANVRLARNNPAEMFVTVWVGIFDPKTGALDYVSAGHNPPLVVRSVVLVTSRAPAGSESARESRALREGVEWLAAPRCPALGVFEGAKYRAAQMTLAAGDRLFLYTDGVTEAMNPEGELFGNERLEATLSGAIIDRALPSAPDSYPGDRALPPASDLHGRARTPSAPPDGLIPLVSRALDAFVAGAEQSDDITMLELEIKS